MVEIFENIRKLYKFESPCEELQEHVEFYSESCLETTKLHFEEAAFTVKMFASWTPTFYINLGGAYTITLGSKAYIINAGTSILIYRNTIVERLNLPADNIFTVKFNPGGLSAVLGLSQANCTDQPVDLATILPAQLLMEIRFATCFEERVALMQQYLYEACSKRKNDTYYVQQVSNAIEEFSAGTMQLNSTGVANKLFISSKTINRYFHKVIGLSPKSYFTMLRTRKAMTAYIAAKTTFVPYEYGYYDHSHFYKDVVKFTGKGVKG